MSEQMTFFPIELPSVLPFKSPYQKWKFENHYRKSDSTEIRCKNCKHRFTTHSYTRTFYKCILLGMSCCKATDITLSSVCDLFIYKKCRLSVVQTFRLRQRRTFFMWT